MSDLELINIKEVCFLFKLGRTTLWRWIKAGSFPKPQYIGPHCPRWRRSELREWLANVQLTMSADFSATAWNSPEQEIVNKIKAYQKSTVRLETS